MPWIEGLDRVARSGLVALPLLLLHGACGSGSKDTATPDSGGGAADGGAGAADAMQGADAPGEDATGGDGAGAEAGADAGGEGGKPGKPTVSSWVGTNLDADLPYADVTSMLSAFDTPAAQLDADGYPVAGAAGASQTDLGYELPTGTYDISYVGTGSLTVSGIGSLVGSWKTVSGEQRNQVEITGTPGSFGNPLILTITNTASQTVTGIHLYLPGVGYDAAVPFNPAFLSALTPFRAMRFMGWQATNDSKLADWADRPASAHFGASPYGVPYEFIAELINETGKDGWVNVPELATPAFIDSFAAFMAKGLDFTRIDAARKAAGFTAPFQLIVENSNETWNTGFSAYGTFLAAAGADPARYTGVYTGTYGPSWMSGDADLMKVGQYEADRLVTIGQAFSKAFASAGHPGVVAPVLSGWALGAAYGDEGLSFIAANYGTPSKYVTYAALAPYFDTPDDTTTGALSTLFPALQADITSMDAVFGDFEKLGAQYHVTIASYEAGQSLTGTTNEPIKHLAQFDDRMYETYAQYLTLWRKDFPTTLFMHFTLSGAPGLPESFYQYGSWGSLPGVEEDLSTCGKNLPTLTGTETIASVLKYCPKYQALADRVPD